MSSSVTVYVVLDRWTTWGDDTVAFITTDYDEIRAWAREINYTYDDDYWVEDISLSKGDVALMAKQIGMKLSPANED